MDVLGENSADPFGDGKKKHVVAKSVRPIRHGEAGAFAGHIAAAPNENERREGGEEGETMQPWSGRWRWTIHGEELDLAETVRKEHARFQGRPPVAQERRFATRYGRSILLSDYDGREKLNVREDSPRAEEALYRQARRSGCRFGCAGRRDGSRRRTDGRFARRPIGGRRRGLRAGEFRPFLQPGLVFRRVSTTSIPFML